MRVSVITPTADRPVAFALAERWMTRQTRQPDEWIVADGGLVPVVCTQGQRHLHWPQPAGPQNFCANLLRGLTAATGDLVVFWEDDDWYRADHLARLAWMAEHHPTATVFGDDQQRYYNLPHRCWRVFQNTGASLCQTALRRAVVTNLTSVIYDMASRQKYGVDTTFWRSIPQTDWALDRMETVVGLKGLPGQVGLGIGHRPGGGWTADPDFHILADWIGPDLSVYADLDTPAAS